MTARALLVGLKVRTSFSAASGREGSRAPWAEGGIAPLGRRRVALIYASLGLFVAGSLFDIATGRDHWPFSPYGMYSSVERARSLQTLRLIGVTRAGSRFPLVANRYLLPFNRAGLRWTLGGFNGSPDRTQRLAAALQDCLRRYEQRRQEGRHRGPPLQALGLYQVQWTLDPLARNVDRPDREELLMQVQAPNEGGG